jgi:hypothetical protein
MKEHDNHIKGCHVKTTVIKQAGVSRWPATLPPVIWFFFFVNHTTFAKVERDLMRYDHTVGRENELCGSILEFLAETGICVIIMQNGILGLVHFAHW